MERDEAALRRLIDDAFVYNASTGTTSGKEALIRALGGVEDDEPAVVYVFPLAGDGATPGEDDGA